MNPEPQQPDLLHPDPHSPAPSPSSSPSLDPSMMRKPVSYSAPLSRPQSSNNTNNNGQMQYQNPQAPVANYSSRFPSANYPQEGTIGSANGYPNPNQYADGQTRSRGGTQTSPQRPTAAPTSYPTRPASSSVSKPQPPSPTVHHQSLYSRPPSANTTASARAVPPHVGPSSLSNVMPQQPPPTMSQFTTPVVALAPARLIQLLLINPNSTRSMTEACIASIRPKLPPNVEVTGYTAPHPAPSAIESTTDAILSTDACIRDLHQHAGANHETVRNFDGFLVACFSKHPLIDALRELYDVPVIGIMEASLYTARMLGGRFGIIATSRRSKILQDDAVAAYGLSHFSVGSEATHLGVLELDSKPKEEVGKRVSLCARRLADRGADVVILGCAGMTDLAGRAAKDAVRDDDGRRLVNVIDGVEAGIWVLSGLAGIGCPTSKKGMFASSHDARRLRGQHWL